MRCTENNINKIKNNKYKMGPRHRELRIGPLGHFQQKRKKKLFWIGDVCILHKDIISRITLHCSVVDK